MSSVQAITAFLQAIAAFLSARFVIRRRLGRPWLLVTIALAVLGTSHLLGALGIVPSMAARNHPSTLEIVEMAVSALIASGFALTERWFLLKERLEDRFRLIADVDHALVGLLEGEKIHSAVCEGLTRGRGYILAWIGVAEPNGTIRVEQVAGPASAVPGEGAIRWDETPEGQSPAGVAIRTGVPCAVNGIDRDPGDAPWRRTHGAHGVRSAAAVRIDVPGDPPLVLSIGSRLRIGFDRLEVEAIAAMARRVGMALVSARRHNLFVSAKGGYDDLLRVQRDGVVCVRGGRIVRANPAAAAMLGFDDPADLSGADPAALLKDSEGAPSLRALLRGECGEEGKGTATALIARRNGTTFAGDLTVTWLPRPSGPRAEGPMKWSPEMRGPVGMIVIRDISRQKAALEDLGRERDFSAKVLDIARALVVEISPAGDILLFNRQCEVVTGYASSEVLGRSLADLLLPEKSRFRYENAFADVWMGQAPSEVEFTILTKSGEERLIAWNLSSLRNPEGKVASIVATGIDMTEKRRLEAQVIGMQKMEAVGTLAGGLAHDFNNILTGILGNLDLARQMIPAGVPASGPIHESIQASERAAVLVRQLLEFSRRSPLERKAVNVREVAREVVHLLKETIDRRIEVEVRAGEGLWCAAADANQVHQVLMNLCVNARDAVMDRLDGNRDRETPPGGYAIRIAASNEKVDAEYCRRYPYAREGEVVVLTVEDNGSGMDDATQRRVFEPFFTTKKLGRGTGLGLSTVYGIVKQHDGWINLESTPGQGTVFRVYLPRAPEPCAVAEPCASVQARSASGGETVLLVDDEAMIRELGRRILEKNGYTVLTAVDGQEGLNIFARERSRLDLVILDMTMPYLSGLEVLERIRNLKPQIKVILSSGYPVGGGYSPGIVGGVAAFLQKPYRAEALARLVREVLDAGR